MKRDQSNSGARCDNLSKTASPRQLAAKSSTNEMASPVRPSRNWPAWISLAAVSIARCYFITRDANFDYLNRKLYNSSADDQARRSFGRRACAKSSSQKWSVERVEDQKFSWSGSGPASGAGGSSRDSLPNLDAYLKFYYNFSLVFNIYYALKHLLIIVLDFELLRGYRYLDCYLLGRLCLNVRVVGMANLFACLISSFQVLWALTLHLAACRFRMPFVEFLWHKEQEVAYWHERSAKRKPSNGSGGSISSNTKRSNELANENEPQVAPESRLYYLSLYHYFSAPQRRDSRKRSEVLIRLNNRTPLLARGESFGREESSDCHSPAFKLRPNRSLECWRKLCRSCNSFTLFCIIITTAFNFVVWWWALPLVLFKFGYELSYQNCVRYIAEQKASSSNNGTVDLWIDHKLIFDPAQAEQYKSPQRPLYLMSLLHEGQQLIDFNWYHTTRALLCTLEMFVFYTELHTSFSSKAIITIIMTSDICNYCTEINGRLDELLRDQRSLLQSRVADQVCTLSAASKRKHTQLRQLELSVRRETVELQAMIGDMFELVNNYNRFASIQVSFLILLWLCYSALVSGWMFLPQASLPKAEWYTLHGFATTFLLIIMVPFARVRRNSRHLHQKMSIAMALDGDYRGSKRAWLALLRFYMPVPMYCFTIRRNVEMSMLFALKLVAWLFTALSVISSIFIFRCAARPP